MSLWCSEDENYFKKLPVSRTHTQAKAYNGPVCPKEPSTFFLSVIFSHSCLPCQHVNVLSPSHPHQGYEQDLCFTLLVASKSHHQTSAKPAGQLSEYLLWALLIESLLPLKIYIYIYYKGVKQGSVILIIVNMANCIRKVQRNINEAYKTDG